MHSSFYLLVGLSLFLVFALLVCLGMSMPSRATNRRIAEVTRHRKTVNRQTTRILEERLLRTFKNIRSYLGVADNSRLQERFLSGGLRSGNSIEFYFAARMLGPIAGLIAGTFIPTNTFVWIVGFAGAAYMAPEFWLDRKIKSRRELIRKGLPDSIDLLVICVDAGLGLDQAMLRVGQELAVSHPEINEEFLQINREQRAGRPRIEAWRNMAARTKLPDIQGFVSMLLQTERFGTPIARALNTFADGMRLKRKQAAEEKAAKTTVKMLFPLVLFIFPCIFIVLLGPAIIAVSKGLFTMTQ